MLNCMLQSHADDSARHHTPPSDNANNEQIIRQESENSNCVSTPSSQLSSEGHKVPEETVMLRYLIIGNHSDE
ncbi:hypothetical protein DdX_14284 [Ditylenchus destructor]|uniref:Uncharacterized protein n=1 Tax=Ditylenchus destructor TaxID=166010 RepID=A0AAD4MS47_9BILA|nr:hypothetical protein DdX_14284 [Ditylenchus destructor]